MNTSQLPLNNREESNIPLPLDIRSVKNYDNTLGGQSFRVPKYGPCSKFRGACRKTPSSTFSKRVIPWDDLKGEFVFAAIQKGALGRKSMNNGLNRKGIKAIFDQFLNSKDIRNPTRKYPICFWLVLIFLLLFMGAYAFVIFVLYNDYFNKFARDGYFWIFVGVPTIFFFFVVFLICIGRRRSESLTKARAEKVHEACNYINQNYGLDGWQLKSGLYGAWVELWIDPRVLEQKYMMDSKYMNGSRRFRTPPKESQIQRSPRSGSSGRSRRKKVRGGGHFDDYRDDSIYSSSDLSTNAKNNSLNQFQNRNYPQHNMNMHRGNRSSEEGVQLDFPPRNQSQITNSFRNPGMNNFDRNEEVQIAPVYSQQKREQLYKISNKQNVSNRQNSSSIQNQNPYLSNSQPNNNGKEKVNGSGYIEASIQTNVHPLDSGNKMGFMENDSQDSFFSGGGRSPRVSILSLIKVC